MSCSRLLRLYEVGKRLFYKALRVDNNFFEQHLSSHPPRFTTDHTGVIDMKKHCGETELSEQRIS